MLRDADRARLSTIGSVVSDSVVQRAIELLDDALAQSRRDAREEERWYLVEERPPALEKEVLAWVGAGDGALCPFSVKAKRVGEAGTRRDWVAVSDYEEGGIHHYVWGVTAWRPLPQPPQETAG